MSVESTRAGDSIVVLLDPRHPSQAALAAAAALAPEPRPHVHGMLIEDQNVLRLGALVDAREVTLGGAQRPVPDVAALDRQLQADAREVRRLFEAAAAQFAVRATFEVRRGQPIRELTRGASGARALVVGRARAPALRAWWSGALPQLLAADVGHLAFASAEPAPPEGVVALASDAGAELTRLAEQIAQRTRLGILRLPAAAAAAALPAAVSRGQSGLIRYLIVPARSTPTAVLSDLLRCWRCTIVLAR